MASPIIHTLMGSKLLRIRSLNRAEVVTTIQAKSMRKGVLLNLHSAGRQNMSSGLLDAACDRVVYVDNLNCINVLLRNWKFKLSKIAQTCLVAAMSWH